MSPWHLGKYNRHFIDKTQKKESVMKIIVLAADNYLILLFPAFTE